MSRLKKLVIAIILALLAVVMAVVLLRQRASAPAGQITGTGAPNTSASPATTTPAPAAFNKQLYSRDDPASLWVVVNKGRPLPSSYAPSDLTVPSIGGGQMRKEASMAIENLARAAAQVGYSVKIISAYRSYSSQASVYNSFVNRDGQAAAETYSARPGYSEHQTGWAVDVGNSSGNCDLEVCFGDTALGQWVAAHAHEYGFIIRYSKDQPTGYQYEPWHLRYVGVDLAKQLHDANQTMEVFFGLPVVTKYPN